MVWQVNKISRKILRNRRHLLNLLNEKLSHGACNPVYLVPNDTTKDKLNSVNVLKDFRQMMYSLPLLFLDQHS